MHVNTKEWLKIIAQTFEEYLAFEWYEDINEVIERFNTVEKINGIEKSIFDDIYISSTNLIVETNYKGLNLFDIQGIEILIELLQLQKEFEEWKIDHELTTIINLSN